jgi:Na+/H+-dicarboxylate symporter
MPLSLKSLPHLHLRSLGEFTEYLDALVSGRLWLKVLVAMFVGIGAGIALGPAANWVSPALAHQLAAWLALPGELFLGVVQMIIGVDRIVDMARTSVNVTGDLVASAVLDRFLGREAKPVPV